MNAEPSKLQNYYVVGYEDRGFTESPIECAWRYVPHSWDSAQEPMPFRTLEQARAACKKHQHGSSLNWDVVPENQLDLDELAEDCGLIQ